jgi:hypothetical protein
MSVRLGAPAATRVALALTAAMVLSSCGGGGSSPRPPVADPAPPPGVTRVTGTERLAWDQEGDLTGLTFRAYVNESPVGLGTGACDFVNGSVVCTAPLPPLADGTYTISVVAVSADGVETERSGPITVQKVSSRSVVSVLTLPDAGVSTDGLRMEAVVTAADGHTFGADVVARGLKAPVQLASAPDGRLLIAEADGRVRVLRPGSSDREEVAFDARALMSPPPLGPPGLALHPDFARSRLAYVSFLAQEPSGQRRLRIVRLREVSNTLGEAATIFEAPVERSSQAAPVDAGRSGASDPFVLNGPRLAFGPDRLLYALLPPGTEFSAEPSASQPVSAMLRLRDDGRAPDSGPLSGVTAHPLGFAWHPDTAALWGIVPTSEEEGVVQTLPHAAGFNLQTAPLALRMTNGVARVSGEFTFRQAGAMDLARAMTQTVSLESVGIVRLAIPVLIGDLLPGVSGQVLDVIGNGGHAYLATADPSGFPGGDYSATVIRLTPQAR